MGIPHSSRTSIFSKAAAFPAAMVFNLCALSLLAQPRERADLDSNRRRVARGGAVGELEAWAAAAGVQPLRKLTMMRQ
jgi:hypothetical protein